MKTHEVIRVLTVVMAGVLLTAAGRSQEEGALKEEATIELGGKKVLVKKLDALPFVENEYSRRFRFDGFENPKLKELRERYKLESVIAPGKDEFEQQVLLLDWVHKQFKKFGRPTCEAKGALEILKAIEEGHTFFCSHYAKVFVSAAASLGWVDRELALRRHQGTAQGGSTEHSTTEIWSNQHRKWVMMDPTANMHIQKNGVPLNAAEIRLEWFYRQGKNLVFVVGKEQKRYRKADLPIFLARFAGFGDLTVPADELDKYGFIGYIPNTNLMDEREDYGKMFIAQDELCVGTRWHTRQIPANPLVDPYFPVGQAALSLLPDGDKIVVKCKTLTPNFKEYQARVDEGNWGQQGEEIAWKLHGGVNRLSVRTVNGFGVQGPVSIVEVSADGKR